MKRLALLAAGGISAVLLALELLLQALPVSSSTMTGYYVDPDVLTYPPGHAWVVSTGWDLRNPQHLRANNWGFAASRDFVPDSNAVALIGDSYVEASMLLATQRPAVQLEAALDGARPVFGLGSPGTALIDYAQRVRLASQHFEVRDFVIWLERGDVRQSLCGSGNVHSRCLSPQTLQPSIERHAPPSPIKRLVRHSALAQYFMGQLKLRPVEVLNSIFVRQPPAAPALVSKDQLRVLPGQANLSSRSRREIDAVVAKFFEDAGPFLHGRLVFLIDGRRSGSPRALSDDDLRRFHLMDQLRQRGAEVVDLELIYARHGEFSRRALDVGPYDAHLNGLGVALVMHEAARRLRQDVSPWRLTPKQR